MTTINATSTGNYTSTRTPRYLGDYVNTEPDVKQFLKKNNFIAGPYGTIEGDTINYNGVFYKYMCTKASNFISGFNDCTITGTSTYNTQYEYEWIRIYLDVASIKLNNTSKLVNSYGEELNTRSINDIVSINFYNGTTTVVEFYDKMKKEKVKVVSQIREDDEFNESMGVSICVLKYLAGNNVFTKVDKILKDKRAKEKAEVEALIEEKQKEIKAEIKREKRKQKRFEAKVKKQAEFELAVKKEVEALSKKRKLVE